MRRGTEEMEVLIEVHSRAAGAGDDAVGAPAVRIALGEKQWAYSRTYFWLSAQDRL